MYTLVLLFLFAGALASTVPKPNYNLEDAEALFEDFVKTYQKVYLDHNERVKRFEIFKKTLEEINRLNADPNETAHFAVNKFADLEWEEFKKLYTGFIAPSNANPINMTLPDTSVDIKVSDSFNWADKGAVTKVKNQGGCGSDWAFAAIGTVEGAYAINHKELVELSEQQIVDCDTKSHGCLGGSIDKALEYLQQVGSQSEESYPYKATNKTCEYNKAKVKAKVTGSIPGDIRSEDALAQQLKSTGPIAIVLNTNKFMNYHGGILQDCTPGSYHQVLLVGYGTDNGTDFWLVKNAWGTTWGEKGYIRIKRGVNACGILNVYARIAKII